MDPVSNLSQTKLSGNKLTISPEKRQKQVTTVIAFLVVVLVIAAILTGAYLLITRNNQGTATTTTTVDTTALTVKVSNPVRTIVNPTTEITVVSNKEITLEQSNRASLKAIGQQTGEYYYVVKVANLPTETTDINLKFDDAAGGHFEQKASITRKPGNFPAGFTQIVPWADAAYVLDANQLNVAVDNKHRLLEDYIPTDLVDLNKDYGLYTLNSATLRRDAAIALKAMLNALAKETGKYVTVASGYRSYDQQVSVYATNIALLGETKANTVSAKPGHSQHQLGTTVDFVSDETSWSITNTFGDTVAGKWLAEHCADYGFIVPYKVAGADTSGFIEESWHFRFQGVQPQTAP